MIGVWFEPESVAWERERSELIRLDCILTKEQKNHGQNKTKNNLIRWYYCISLRNQAKEMRERKREKELFFYGVLGSCFEVFCFEVFHGWTGRGARRLRRTTTPPYVGHWSRVKVPWALLSQGFEGQKRGKINSIKGFSDWHFQKVSNTKGFSVLGKLTKNPIFDQKENTGHE